MNDKIKKVAKRVKFFCPEAGVRGWISGSKIEIIGVESDSRATGTHSKASLNKYGELRKHHDHIDNTYGHNGKEILVDCPNGSGNVTWVPLNELLPIEAPPATPESLNPDLGAESAQVEKPSHKCPSCGKSTYFESAKGWRPFCSQECAGKGTATKESAKECPDCHGNFEGAEGETCPTCGRFAIQKEALRPALPPQILNRRQEVNASKGVCRHCKKEDGTYNPNTGVCDSCEDEMRKAASLNKVATVVHRTDGWHVLSEKGKNLGGPYKSKAEAVKRLRQVEYFKHHGSMRPFSKQVYAEVLTDPYQTLSTHITEMRTRMDQVNERLQNAPAVKTAKEDATPEMDLAALFADLTQGIDLLETKLGGDDIEPELHKGVEELENKLWTLEEKLGLTPKLSEEERAEPEHKKIVEDIDKEAGRRSYCEKCDKQISHGRFCDKCKEKEVKKEAAVVTDETIEETTNDPNATLTPPATATAPTGLQPTDFNGVDPKQMPTSPLPPGQRWVWDVENNKFIAMTDPTDPSKLV